MGRNLQRIARATLHCGLGTVVTRQTVKFALPWVRSLPSLIIEVKGRPTVPGSSLKFVAVDLQHVEACARQAVVGDASSEKDAAAVSDLMVKARTLRGSLKKDWSTIVPAAGEEAAAAEERLKYVVNTPQGGFRFSDEGLLMLVRGRAPFDMKWVQAKAAALSQSVTATRKAKLALSTAAIATKLQALKDAAAAAAVEKPAAKATA